MKRRDFAFIVACSALLSAALVLFFLRWPAPPPATAEVQPLQPITADETMGEEEKVNIVVYRRVSDSVVNVTSTRLELNFWLQAVPMRGTGTGFVVDNEGHIVTNHHVIQDAEQLEVTLSDGSKQEAEMVGRDPVNDLAVLKIDCPRNRCRPIPLATSSRLQVGQKVLAIGNPFGLERTLTTGIISSLGRSLETEYGVLDGLIQTDAAINHGNSGGPLLNRRGEVIGVNTAILSKSGDSAGIGLAVPVDTLSRILPDLLEFGHVRRAWWGGTGRALTPQLAQALRAPVEKGFLVEEVQAGGSAEAAGLKGGTRRAYFRNMPIIIGGEIVVSLDGAAVETPRDILGILEDKRPGQRVRIVYYRDQRRVEEEVELRGRQTRRFRF